MKNSPEGESGPGLGMATMTLHRRPGRQGRSSHRLTASMKREDTQPVTVEDFYRRCPQGINLRLGRVASKRGGQIRRHRRIVGGKKQAALWDRLRAR